MKILSITDLAIIVIKPEDIPWPDTSKSAMPFRLPFSTKKLYISPEIPYIGLK